MNIHIVGAGAIGLLFGGYLADAGAAVTFWTRSKAQAELLLQNGLHLEEAGGSAFTLHPESWTARDLNDSELSKILPCDAPDWLLVTTKQNDLNDSLITAITSIAGPHTNIACLQNGVGHIARMSSLLGGQPVFSIITTEGSAKLSDNMVRRAGIGETKLGISMDQLHTDSSSTVDKAAETLLNLLNKAGFPSFLSKDIDKDIYRKLLINSVINPLTALLRIPNGDLLLKEETIQMIRKLCMEAEQVYTACGIPFDYSTFEVVTGVCRSTSSNTSSMLGDILQGRATEIDAINGHLVSIAQSAGIHTPMHEALWLLVKSLHPQ